jgi:streptogramin lyase
MSLVLTLILTVVLPRCLTRTRTLVDLTNEATALTVPPPERLNDRVTFPSAAVESESAPGSGGTADASGNSCSAISGATTSTYLIVAADGEHTLRLAVTATNAIGSATATSAQSTLVVSPPVNTAAPTVAGSVQVGSTLTGTSGTWTGTPTITYGYKWLQCNSSGSGCAAIGGATAITYVPVVGDAGHTLRFEVTASNAAGAAAAQSSQTTLIATSPVNTALPTISGTGAQGATMTATTGTWSGTPTPSYTYQWQRCNTSGTGCGAISGATSSTYVTVSADGGSTLDVVVTATNSAGSVSATSGYVAVVGAITEFSSGLKGSASGLAKATDGNVWFADPSGYAGKISTAGTITEYKVLEVGSQMDGHTAATPDGSFWIYEDQPKQETAMAMKINTSTGKVVGSAGGGYIDGMAAGPEGNLWFNVNDEYVCYGCIEEQNTNGVGINSWEAGDYGGIWAGSSGSMWFGGTESISRLAIGGAITTYKTGLPVGAFPFQMALGPDGNMWFTDATTHALGRITPAGAITEYSSGLNAGAVPTSITAGPDGNVWFTDEGTTKAIGRITPSGVVTEFTTGLKGSPSSIVTGADGALWFGVSGTPNGIGRIAPG